MEARRQPLTSNSQSQSTDTAFAEVCEEKNANISALQSHLTVQNDAVEDKRAIRLIGRKMMVSCLIQRTQLNALWDTGAQVSLVSEGWLKENLLQEEYTIRPIHELVDKVLLVEGVGSQIPYLGYAMLQLHLGRVDRGETITVPFLVVKEDIREPIIGTNVMEEFITGQSIKEKLQGLDNCSLKESEIGDHFTEPLDE